MSSIGPISPHLSSKPARGKASPAQPSPALPCLPCPQLRLAPTDSRSPRCVPQPELACLVRLCLTARSPRLGVRAFCHRSHRTGGSASTDCSCCLFKGGYFFVRCYSLGALFAAKAVCRHDCPSACSKGEPSDKADMVYGSGRTSVAEAVLRRVNKRRRGTND